MSPRPLLVADLFCGAGGSSTGAKRAAATLGRRMELVCVNHWDRAIETHSRMHPEARHYCQDVAAVRPRAVVPEGRLDLLMASPTCTYHSRARGGRPTSDQQRMDPWHVVTWLTELRVKRVLVENVPEFVDWGPVDARSGRPLASRRGDYFREWLATLERLGFKVEWRILNAADYGDATTRRRFFLQARSDRQPIAWPAATHSKDGRANLLGQGAQRWRAAREVIDWSLKGRSIFDRKRPLSAKTIARIFAGAVKFRWPEPFIVVLRRHADARGIDLPLPSIAAMGNHVGLATPVLLGQHFDRRCQSIDEPVPTVTSVARIGVVEPFVLAQGAGGAPRNATEPMPTIVGGGAHALVAPYYSSGSGETCKSVEAPLNTIPTKARFGLVVPITHHDGSNRARHVDEPLPTLTTAKRGELALITGAFGERDGQAPRVRSVAEPVPTICTHGSVPLVEPVSDGRHFDILFRMLDPHELARAMSFSDGEIDYEFAGTKTEVTRQIGNAVPVRTAQALVAAAFHDMTPAVDVSPTVPAVAAE